MLNYKCAIPRLFHKRRAPAEGRDNRNGKIENNNNRNINGNNNSKGFRSWPSSISQ